VLRGIRHFGPQGRLGYVHFRDVQETGDQVAECFLGEGNLDVTAVLRTLK
jgi:mannonate dehydratase